MAAIDLSQLNQAHLWIAEGRQLIAAIVTSSWGSSPRQAGAMMLIDNKGRISGSVSGGCVEASVIETALNLFDKDRFEALHFGIDDELAWSQGLSCGGEMTLLLVPIKEGFFAPDIITALIAASDRRDYRALTIDINSGAASLSDAPMPALPERIHLDLKPQKQLVLIGAGHISQHLAQLAIRLDYQVIVIDPRPIFITSERFPDCQRFEDWPDRCLPQLTLDKRSALVTLTHDARIDDDALQIAIHKPLFHIAALGSRKTHTKRCARLETAGFDKELIQRIKGPAGLDIHALSPAEIALSIMAEITAVQPDGKGK